MTALLECVRWSLRSKVHAATYAILHIAYVMKCIGVRIYKRLTIPCTFAPKCLVLFAEKSDIYKKKARFDIQWQPKNIPTTESGRII